MDIFKKLEELISKSNKTILGYYNQGLEKVFIEESIKSLGLNPTLELINLYHWRNGLENYDLPTGLTSIFPFGVFAPLEESIKSYKESLELEPDECKGFFPILLDDEILIDLNKESSSYGALFLRSYSLQIVEPEKIYSSIPVFLQTIIKYYELGIYAFDKEGMHDIDFDELFRVSKELNPDCQYWD